MLMGQLPGSLPAPAFNGYTGAQRYIAGALQPYALPQPVPRPPVLPSPPPPPVASLPPAIEAWRAQLLAMHPLFLSRQLGLPIGHVKQLLEDPQAATALYFRTHQQINMPNRPLGGGRGFGSAQSPESVAREVEKALRGFTDNPAGLVDIGSNIAGLASGVGAVKSLTATAVERALGLEPGTLGGLRDIRGLQHVDKALIDKIGSKKPGGGIYSATDAFNEQRALNDKRDSDRAASRGAGPGSRGPKGGGAYGGMGGVGSHGV